MNILITGAGGFIGRSLTEYLTPRYQVFAATHSDLELLDQCAVQKYISENRIDTIIHCASVGGSRKDNYDAENHDIVGKNVRMFVNLEQCLNGDMRMIHLGSGAEYDRVHWRKKMEEEYFGRHIPKDGYGLAKYIISRLVEHRKNVVCLRIFGLFGCYEDYRFKFITNAIIKNLLHMPIIINQNVVFDYLYITDFLRIVEWFINNRHKYSHYNVTPTQSVDLMTIAKLVNGAGKDPSEIVVLNNGLNTEYTGDNTRLLAELGGFDFTYIGEAIEELYEYYHKVLSKLDVEWVRTDAFLKCCKTK